MLGMGFDHHARDYGRCELRVPGSGGSSGDFNIKPLNLELVLTGRDATSKLIELADYVSEIIARKQSAGTFSLILSIISVFSLPSFKFVLSAMVLGYFSYGLSIVPFIRAMRELGSARASAFFGAAPFVGAALSLLLFRESQGMLFFFALPNHDYWCSLFVQGRA